MALALLEPSDETESSIRFRIDTGTNPYAQLKIGRKVRRDHGIDWVDEVYFATPLVARDRSRDLLNTADSITVPRARLERGRAYAQLFSFKDANHRAPGFSRVVGFPVASGGRSPTRDGSLLEMQQPMTILTQLSFETPRRVKCRTATQTFAQSASLNDLLGEILRVVAPVVQRLVNNGAQDGTGTPGGTNAPGTTPSSTSDAIVSLVASLLRAIGNPGQITSGSQSVDGSTRDMNRFAQPFIFGIDDALIGALAGPILQALPQMMNAANQRRLDLRNSSNKLISDLLSDVNRRMLLEKLIDAQKQAPAGQQPQSADLNQLMQLLQAAAPAAPATTAPPPAGTTAQSLAMTTPEGDKLASRAVVTYVHGPAVPLHGHDAIVYSKTHGLALRVRLDVTEPVPKRPLSKAIVKVTFKDGEKTDPLTTKTFKLKDLAPNTPIPLRFEPSELAHLPIGKPLTAFAEIRWQGSQPGSTHKALGSSDLVVVEQFFVSDTGREVAPERELTDMTRFRSFWNKVWESPVLDSTRDGRKRFHWALDVTTKYSVLLASADDTNGLMETKLLQSPNDYDSAIERIEGRMKSGIELSVDELNKLLPLWPGESPLPPERLAAFRGDQYARESAREMVQHFEMKGSSDQRGMIWIAPVFKLFAFALAAAKTAEGSGQVTSLAEESVRFPLPVAACVIGVKSK